MVDLMTCKEGLSVGEIERFIKKTGGAGSF
jgi:hypothetical protein